MKFSQTTKEKLGFYVYGLVDPRDNLIFYVGKASGNDRAFDHLKAAAQESKKQQRILEIRALGGEPIVEILRYGLKSPEGAFEVEAAIIDAIGIENLTNLVRGHGIERGRLLAKEVERLYGSKPVPIDQIAEPCMLFYVQNSYSPTMTEIELYDSVRQYWHQVSESNRRSLAHRVALGVVQGVVVKVYSIAGWYPAGTTLSTRRFLGGDDKWEFVGQAINDHPLTGRLLVNSEGKPIPGSQKGYSYLPLKSVA